MRAIIQFYRPELTSCFPTATKDDGCIRGQFTCKNKSILNKTHCIEGYRVCDEFADCADKSDEVSCCGYKTIRCDNGINSDDCISLENICGKNFTASDCPGLPCRLFNICDKGNTGNVFLTHHPILLMCLMFLRFMHSHLQF